MSIVEEEYQKQIIIKRINNLSRNFNQTIEYNKSKPKIQHRRIL